MWLNKSLEFSKQFFWHRNINNKILFAAKRIFSYCYQNNYFRISISGFILETWSNYNMNISIFEPNSKS